MGIIFISYRTKELISNNHYFSTIFNSFFDDTTACDDVKDFYYEHVNDSYNYKNGANYIQRWAEILGRTSTDKTIFLLLSGSPIIGPWQSFELMLALSKGIRIYALAPVDLQCMIEALKYSNIDPLYDRRKVLNMIFFDEKNKYLTDFSISKLKCPKKKRWDRSSKRSKIRYFAKRFSNMRFE